MCTLNILFIFVNNLNTYTMKDYEIYFWEQMSDNDLQQIVSSNEHLTAYQLRAMEELNSRAINYPIK